MVHSRYFRKLYGGILLILLGAGIIGIIVGRVTRLPIGAGIGVGVVLLLGFFFVRHITRHLITMTKGVESISRGDYNQRIQIHTGDEFEILAQSFNRIAEQLREGLGTITLDRNRLLAILGGMVEGVVAVDQKERIVHMNQVAGKILRTSPEESVGKWFWDVTRFWGAREALASTLREGVKATEEIRIEDSSGDKRIEVNTSPLLDGQGQLVGAVMVLHDLTELRRLEMFRRDFISNVSHELKTPVTAIRGIIETLREDETMDPENRKRFLSKAVNQTARLSTLVTDLLTLSRIESDKGSLDRETLDLRDLLHESAASLRMVGEGKGLTIETKIPDLPLIFEGDRELLRQSIDNLLDNAIKYTPEGGHIWLRVRTEDRLAVIEVEDTGIGIAPQDQERIFERFYRVDKARSRELGGTGLGLSIVKHITLAHGGDVSVTSSLDKGSIFRIRLPITPPSP